ncbi:hypothetical protein [Priestia megaterium]|uniref:hypothetical protein n=1 Tax=Priestia megaterium TaxID=1404 RepID=UPI002FFDE061
MIRRQGKNSCGKSGTGETPQERKREEAQRPPPESDALHGNQLRCHKRFSSCYPICSSLKWIHVVISQPLLFLTSVSFFE